jgi:dCMP deaminase
MRISRETMLMEMAHVAAKRGTCGRLAVGAVIAVESRPISIGYVGALPGAPHCWELQCDLSKPCTRTVHAELNAINWAVRQGLEVEGADMYITDSPCLKCAQEIANHRLGRIFFDRQYRIHDGVDHLMMNGHEVYQVLANGFSRRITL